MKNLIGIVCALVGALTACATETDEARGTDSNACEEAPEVASALSPKKITVNGMSLNGMSLNGMSLNGVATNGVATNGIEGNGIAINGMSLNGVVLHGIRVRGEALVGGRVPALLSDGTTIDLDVRAFEPGPDGQDEGLYELGYRGQSLCADGEKGIFVPGVWDAHGARHDAITIGSITADATFSCTSGVIAKCVRWGYAPSRVGAALHQTCTRMARADYCGSGVSFTRPGTAIDVDDVQGVQRAAGEPGFLFEAGWSERGAVCVSRPRYDATDARGNAMLPSCWRDLPTCATPAEATSRGATITNASRPQTRRLCL